MKKYFIFYFLFLVGCSEVEFAKTDEFLRGELNKNDIQINYGALYTQDKAVHLSILGEEDQEMYVTNDPTCATGGEWEKYNPEKEWDLSQLNQTARVYVKFKGEKDVESDCLSDDIIHDNIPPELSFKNTPRRLNNQKELNIHLIAKDNASGVDESFCALEGNQNFVKCKDKLNLQDITEGHHKLKFSAVDKAGNKAEPIELNWKTDLTPPKAHFHKVPPKLSNLSDFSLQYYAEDENGIAGFNCSYNKKSYSSCKAETFLKQLKGGKHSFYVIAVDQAGNLSKPIDYDWVVDKDAPTVQITKHPSAYTRDLRSEFQFIGTDEGIELKDYECQVNNENWIKCVSPFITPSLSKGVQAFRVRTIDLAGNYSAESTYSWVIDLTPPEIKIIDKPAMLTNKSDADFSLQATDLESGVKKFWCWLDNQPLICTSSVKINKLAEGKHLFEAAAEDNVGNFSVRARYNWTIDQNPPQLKFTKLPALYIAEDFSELGFVGVDDQSSVKEYFCKFLNGKYETCKSPQKVNGLKEGKQVFYVKATDEAGNESEPISYSWHVDQTPPVISFISKPNDHFNLMPSQFKLKIEDKISGFEKAWCGLKGQLTDCKSDEFKSFDLLPGVYEFEVIAMDKVGNKSSSSHRWEVIDKFKSVEQNFTIDKNGADVDILFVIDNSDSMSEEQRNMAQRIDNFISKVEDLNWNIAVTSTDPNKTSRDPFCSNDWGCSESPIEHGDGGFVKFSNGSYILKPNVQANNAQTMLGSAIQLGTGGSSSEEGIRATYRVLEKSLDSKYPEHQSFLRSHAPLAVVLISDEDESDNRTRNKPENLLNFIKQNWPQKSFKFHSMIDLPEFNCDNNVRDYGKEYKKLSEATGGVIGSVCQDNYSNDLANIGEEVRKQVSTVELMCLPQDKDMDGTPDLTVELEGGQKAPNYKFDGQKVIFAKPLPPGQHKLIYNCLK